MIQNKRILDNIRHELKIIRRVNNDWRSGVLTACVINIEVCIDELEQLKGKTKKGGGVKINSGP